MGSLTESIDLQCRLGKCKTYKLIYRVCRMLGTMCKVYISESTTAGWNAAFSPSARRKLGCKCKLAFCYPLAHLLDFEILKSLIFLSLICHGVITVKNWSTNNSRIQFLGGCMLMSAKGKTISIETSKYLTKCHKGLYLHVVPWVGHND